MQLENAKITTFLKELVAINRKPCEDIARFDLIKNAMLPCLYDTSWLNLNQYCFDADGISRHLLHQEPQHGLAVVVIAWQPGVCIKPHNHYSWGIIGCLQGIEKNIFWQPTVETNSAKIQPIREVLCQPGDIITFMPEDIHSVANVSEQVAVSLHIYGCLNTAGYSTYQVFDTDTDTSKLFETDYS